MAAVSVFVDDAIRGTLPLVCAKTGEPADVLVRTSQPVGNRFAPVWLLTLLGPPGWVVVFLFMVLAPGMEYLTVRIPESNGARDRERSLMRVRLTAFGLCVLALVSGVVHPGPFPVIWLALGAAFLLAGIALHGLICFERVGVSIDVSRRWVTFTRVHPAFVEAVNRQQSTTPGAR